MWLQLLDSPVFSIVYLAVLIGSVFGGYLLARKAYVARQKKWVLSGVKSSIIGFFALIISFTLSSAYGSSHDRNAFVQREADAVVQLYRESFLVSPPLRSEVQRYLSQHVNSLVGFLRTDTVSVAGMRSSLTVQNEAFYAAMTSDSTRAAAFAKHLPAYNELTSASFRMLYSYDERTPSLIMGLLVLSSWLIGLLVGFMNGFYERPHILVPFLYILLVAFTLKAITDLDNPLQGAIRPHSRNLEDLQALIYPRTN